MGHTARFHCGEKQDLEVKGWRLGPRKMHNMWGRMENEADPFVGRGRSDIFA
jgi:hypothetical protein